MSGESHPLWPRVSGLKTRLRDHVQVHRHYYRGKPWYVLQDRASSQYYRFGTGVYHVVRLMDGERTVQEILDLVVERGDDAPTQKALIDLLASLQASDLLQCNVPQDTRELFARHERGQKGRWKRYLKGPFLIRLPLLDPDSLLERRSAAVDVLFGGLGGLIWLVTLGVAASLAAAYWPELKGYWASRALAPYNLIILCLVYPVVKGLHELAHALTVKRWGGEVHEAGLMFLVFMPLPYVDASAASGFRDKRKRMLVGAAGIMAELFLAGLALFVWLNVETGIVRDIAFDVMLIGGISTVLFNGNPLLRFDAYYVLADAIEIPNLGQRSIQYYGYLVQRYLFGLADTHSPVSARGERGWFLIYGPSSCVYRVVVLFAIVLFVAEKFLIVGVLLGLLAIAVQLINPLARQLAFVIGNPMLRGHRSRALTVVGTLGGGLIAGLFLVPVPSSTYAQGIVWLPEHAQVRAAADGFVSRILAEHNAPVRSGDPLFEIEEPLLEARVRALEWELRELNARYDAQFLADRTEAGILSDQVNRARADLEQVREEAGELTVRSAAAGVFLVPRAEHMPGRFVHKGDVLGYVTDLSVPTVRVVVGQGQVGLVRQHTRAVKVRLPERPWDTVAGTVRREVPSATSALPSRALGTPGGGLIAIDPADPEGLRALDEIFLFEVELPAHVHPARIGARAHVRFEHGKEPLAQQWYRSLRQLFLRRFAV